MKEIMIDIQNGENERRGDTQKRKSEMRGDDEPGEVLLTNSKGFDRVRGSYKILSFI